MVVSRPGEGRRPSGPAKQAERRRVLVVRRQVGGVEGVHVERADGHVLAAAAVVQVEHAHVRQPLTRRRLPARRLRTHTTSTVAGTVNFVRRSPIFYRAMLCIRGTSHGPVSVSVSVCLSVTSRSSTKTAKRTITQTTPHDSPGTLVSDAKDLREIRPGSPPTRLRGRRMQVVWVKIGDF